MCYYQAVRYSHRRRRSWTAIREVWKISTARVAVREVDSDPEGAVRGLLGCFPEAERRLRECGTVFIKVNAVYFHPHLFTSASLVSAAVKIIKEAGPGKKVFIMDNCSQGNFTRLCFAATGLDKAAKRAGARCLYLDEEKPITVTLRPGSGERYEFPAVLYRHLIEDRGDSFYLNMPVLKAHCQAQMTAGLKNQMGLLYDGGRASKHNHELHQLIADIYGFVKPDFTVIDALKVLARGPMPAGRFVEGLLHDKNVVLGGEDTVAVDAVAARVLGHEPREVKHVKLAAEQGLGVADLAEIDVDGKLPAGGETIPWEFETHFPKSIRFVVGSNGACYEGCLGHAEQVLELVVNESHTPGELEGRPLTIVTGRGFDEGSLSGLREPVIVLGRCACEEALETVRASYKEVDALDTCGRCDNILNTAVRRLKVNAFGLSPVSTPKVLYLLLLGKLNGLQYNIPR